MRKINLLDLVKKSLAAFTALAVGFGISAQAVSVDSLKAGLVVKEVQSCSNHGHDHDDEHHNHGHDHDDEHHNHGGDHHCGHDDDHHGE